MSDCVPSLTLTQLSWWTGAPNDDDVGGSDGGGGGGGCVGLQAPGSVVLSHSWLQAALRDSRALLFFSSATRRLSVCLECWLPEVGTLQL